MKIPSTYKEAGVNIDAGNAFVEAIKPLVKKTRRPEVLSGLGGYAGLFRLDPNQYKEPVLVSTTDGVGTKLKLATEMRSYRGIGVDLVAMCVNDLLCVGAEPLFFLDYYACGRLETEQAVQVLEGISSSLADIRCALLGGETAEMPGVYPAGEFDLAGFAVGVVERSQMIDGTRITPGNQVIGLASSGVHSNGFSLVRRLIEKANLDLHKTYPRFSESLGMTLLTPTKIYVNPVLKLQKKFSVMGLAHITGGGLLENIPRILPSTTMVKLCKNTWPSLPIFELLQEKGSIENSEMHRVFNCGIGLIIIVTKEQAEEIVQTLCAEGYPSYLIGEVMERGSLDEPQVVIE